MSVLIFSLRAFGVDTWKAQQTVSLKLSEKKVNCSCIYNKLLGIFLSMNTEWQNQSNNISILLGNYETIYNHS